jgi:hypothetical protein
MSWIMPTVFAAALLDRINDDEVSEHLAAAR